MQPKLKKELPEDAMKLRHYLFNVPYGKYNETRQRLVDACKVSKQTFTNWMQGCCKIPELAKDKMNEVTGIKIF